jgi:exopolyphosphatase/guanosine-5'-triphosphate,3'-diphosphate pyrophosphatase|tara:strand:- start:193 stop:1116 length:924 start_codon:yes stop_codon:yes gene_type:complete
MTRLASIDIGTNTARLLILEKKSDGGLIELSQARAITRLGRGMNTGKKILDDRIDKTISVLIKFRNECRKFEPLVIRAVATSAVREADNQKEFLLKIKKEVGLEVEVVPWEKEADLMVKGVLWKLPSVKRDLLAFDIGGGSTEFILTRDKKIVSAVGTKLGTVRLTEKFISQHPTDLNEYKALESYLRRELNPVKAKLSAFSPEVLIGTAGTVTTLAAIDGSVDPYDPEKIHGESLAFKRVEEILEDLKNRSLEERMAMKVLEKGREDLIIVGGALVLETMRIFECNSLMVSEYGLREGIVLDALNQ